MQRTELLIKFARGLKYNNIPPEVLEHAKKMFLDQFAVILGGISTEASKSARRFGRQSFKEGSCYVFGDPYRLSAMGATWGNAVTGSALDMDEGHNIALGHPAAAVFPAVLAVAEERRLSGKDFLRGFIVGYETACRISVSRLGNKSFASGSWAGIGAAVGSAALLELNENEFKHAIGISCCHMPVRPPSSGYHFVPRIKEAIGWSSMAGVSAAYLAKDGLTGFIDILDRDIYSKKMVEDLGQEFIILKNYFKPYASCRWTHPSIEGAVTLAQKTNLRPDDISSIEVSTFERASLLNNPHPKTSEGAQYSIPWTIACIIVEGMVGPLQVAESKLDDPTLNKLAEKVVLHRDPQSDSLFPEVRRAVVDIRVKNGKVFHQEILNTRGDYLNPLSDDDLEKKFYTLASLQMKEDVLKNLLYVLQSPEKITNIREVTDFLAANL